MLASIGLLVSGWMPTLRGRLKALSAVANASSLDSKGSGVSLGQAPLLGFFSFDP